MRKNTRLRWLLVIMLTLGGCMASQVPVPTVEDVELRDPPRLRLAFHYTHLAHGEPAPKLTHAYRKEIEEHFAKAVADTPYLEQATGQSGPPEYLLEITTTTSQEHKRDYPIILHLFTAGIYPRTEFHNFTVNAQLRTPNGDEIAAYSAKRELRLTHSTALFPVAPFAAAHFRRYLETRADAYREVFADIARRLKRLK